MKGSMKGFMTSLGRSIMMVIVFISLILSSAVMAQKFLGSGIAHIVGNSMEPNMKDGEMYLFAERSKIERYDVVLANFKDHTGNKLLVKRAIGIPGDDIAVIDGVLYIDEKQYDEPYVVNDAPDFEKEAFRKKLGPGEYFLMGDNRDHSLDSRSELGIVSSDDILGVVKRDLTNLKGLVDIHE